MPNGTYGGVRGRKTKVGGKLTTFVFLLLDFSNSSSYNHIRLSPLFLVYLPLQYFCKNYKYIAFAIYSVTRNLRNF